MKNNCTNTRKKMYLCINTKIILTNSKLKYIYIIYDW